MGDDAVIKTLAALAFIGFNFYTYHYLASNPVYPERKEFTDFPKEFGQWSCPEFQFIEANVVDNLGVTDYIICRYASPENPAGVDVYVGYHASQVREEGGGAGENSIHPPAHCLPGSGWDVIDNQTVALSLPELPQKNATVKRLVIAKGKARQLVYYWYQSRGRVISHDWQKIIFVGLDRALRGRTDGSLVRFTIPIVRNDETKADAAFHDLASRIVALLPAYIPE
jgi:EpsI family protein